MNCCTCTPFLTAMDFPLHEHVEIMYLPHKGEFIPRNRLNVGLSHSFDRKPLSPQYEEAIHSQWMLRCRTHPKLWNGSKFRIESVDEDVANGTATFNLGITGYKDFLGTNWSPNAKLYRELGAKNYRNTQAYLSDALGVGALVETKDGYYILIRRSKYCGEAVGLLDIPGGHPEPEEIVGKIGVEEIDLGTMSADAVVQEIFNSTANEVAEEVHIPLEFLTDPELIGIARNTTSSGRPSSEYYIRCSLSSDEVRQRYNEGDKEDTEAESTELFMLPMSGIMTLQNDIDMWNDLSPSAKGCVTLYQLAMKARQTKC